jgi:hypothetical protein
MLSSEAQTDACGAAEVVSLPRMANPSVLESQFMFWLFHSSRYSAAYSRTARWLKIYPATVMLVTNMKRFSIQISVCLLSRDQGLTLAPSHRIRVASLTLLRSLGKCNKCCKVTRSIQRCNIIESILI